MSEDSTPARTGGRWGRLVLLGGLMSMDSSESQAISVLFPTMRTALGLSMGALGALVAVNKLVAVLFGPLWVALAERFGRKAVLVGCGGLWGVWTIAAGLSRDFTQLLVLTTIAAAGFAGSGPLISAILGDMFDDARRGRASGVLFGGLAVVLAVVTPLLGALSGVRGGWRYGFIASGAVTVVFGLLVWWLFEDPGSAAAPRDAERTVEAARRMWSEIREVLALRTVTLVLVQRMTSTQLAFSSFAVVYLVTVRGFTNAQAALIIPFGGLAYVLGTFVAGVVVDKARRRFPRTGRLAVWQLAVLGWALAAGLGSQVAWPSIWVYAAVFTLPPFLQGFNPPANRPVIMAVTPAPLRGTAFALMIGAESVGWALSTVLLGYVGDHIGLRQAVLWFLVVLNLANGLLMFAIYRPYARESAVSVSILSSGLERSSMP